MPQFRVFFTDESRLRQHLINYSTDLGILKAKNYHEAKEELANILIEAGITGLTIIPNAPTILCREIDGRFSVLRTDEFGSLWTQTRLCKIKKIQKNTSRS